MVCLDIHKNSELELLSVLQRLVFNGENNSALVIGPRGSGKTFLIKKVLNDLSHELKAKKCSEDLIVINLSGCLQNSDKSALLEISRQLKLDNVVGDKIFGSFSDSFEFLLKSFRCGGKESKPLIFIMDEFDLFTRNKTQLLLYTLLNTIQSSPSPMCLIGATCRIDVLDLLEKRIKSRFSHRQIYLFNEYKFEKYIEIAKFFLENYDTDFAVYNQSNKVNKILQEYLDEIFNDKQVVKLFTRQFELDKSMTTLRRIILLPALTLKELDKQTLKSKNTTKIKENITESFKLMNMDSKFSLLTGLSILELTLVVVLLEMSQVFVDEPFNFELIYNSYLKFIQRKNWAQQKQERQIVLKAYEHLIALKFILPATENTTTQSKNTKISKEHSLMYLALDKEEIDQCITEYPNCPTELLYHSNS